MPNWCYNNLELSHNDLEMVARAKKAFEDGNFFNEFVPLPEDQEDNWYDWHCENWGTKWDVANQFIGLESSKELELYFDTAWSPPLPFYEKMEKLGFKISAEYKEDGMGYIGEYADGVDKCYEYDFSDENWRDGLPDNILEV